MTESVPVKLAFDVYTPINPVDNNLPPFIFMHGMSSSKAMWKTIPQAVADKTGRKAYACDARNHGKSERSDVFNFDLNAEDLFHFMDTLDIQKAVLVGHSMGGITAIKAALKKPDRIEAIFVEDMHVRRVSSDLTNQVIGILRLWATCVSTAPKDLNETDTIVHAMDTMLSKIPPESARLIDRERWIERAEIAKTENGHYDVIYNKKVVFEALDNSDTLSSDHTGQYDGPAYFIYGSESPFQVGKEEEHIRLHFPKAELIEFEAASHNVHSEFPEKFSDTIHRCFDCQLSYT